MKTIVSVRTSCWASNSGLHTRKDIRVLKRKSEGHDPLMEDAHNMGAAETVASITNLGDVSDGEYSMEMCNIRRDWESNYIDDYSFVLVPLKEVTE